MSIVIQNKAPFTKRGYVPERRYSIHRQKTVTTKILGRTRSRTLFRETRGAKRTIFIG